MDKTNELSNTESVESVESLEPMESIELGELNNLKFENQDKTDYNTNSNLLDDVSYTKIDNLDEDSELKGQKWVCLSFLSPEGVHNCKVRGVKVRGVYSTRNQAEERAEKLRQEDKYFHIFVGEVGKWLAWDPELENVPETNYGNPELQKLMAQQQKTMKKNMDDLNILAGKKKDLINNDAQNHKMRVAQTIKEAQNSSKENSSKENSSKENSSKEAKDPLLSAAKRHDPSASRDRLRNLIKQRQSKQTQPEEKTAAQLRDELSAKEDERLKNLEKAVNEDSVKVADLNKSLAYMQTYIEQQKNK
jgi:hypothetical protein